MGNKGIKKEEIKVNHFLKNGKKVESIKGKVVKVDPTILMRRSYK